MQLPDHYEFISPVKINSGHRALDHIPFELDALNAFKPLVLTTKEISGKGCTDLLIDAFRDSGMTSGIFDAVPSNPDIKLVRDLHRIYTDKGFDAIIAMGNGAAADTAKALNIVVSGRPEDLAMSAGENSLSRPLRPFIFVPAGCADGLEVSRYATLADMSFSSHYLMPDVAVIDPRMMTPEDAVVTASSAMTALTHAVECFISRDRNPLADAYAYPSIQLLMENLKAVIKQKDNRKGRLALANAAILSGCAFSSAPKGIVHELGAALSRHTSWHAGVCRGLVLPWALRYRQQKGMSDTADLLLPMAGFDVDAETIAEDKEKKVRQLLFNLIKDLCDAGALPKGLKSAGIGGEVIDSIAAELSLRGFSADECREIQRQAWEGMPAQMPE
jgi:alcohol dehydrogenase